MTPVFPLLLSTALTIPGGLDDRRVEPEPAGSAEGSPSPARRSKDAPARPRRAAEKAQASDEVPWIRRYPPERGMIELGVMGGVYLPGRRHELFEATFDRPDQGFRPYAPVGPELGVRASYLLRPFLGLELEGAVMPTTTDDAYAQPVYLWAARGGVLGQIPGLSLTPFLLVGFGALGVASDPTAAGVDVDPGLYFGGGLKAQLSRRLQLRIDLRDMVSNRRGVANGFENHNFEALLGLSITLGRSRPDPGPEPPVDTDGDGLDDEVDACPREAGPAPEGCPIRDEDGDGILDPEDACPREAGPAPEGCPRRDSDGDGIDDAADACPDEAGVAPDGCPPRDTDGDGILDPEDACVQEPETVNGFEDSDGCPDELPEEVQRFSGTIEGILFETSKAVIRPQSRPVLDAAAELLAKYPDLRLEISGHTDSRGPYELNVSLSQERADAVRDYLVGKGIAAERLQTRGAGPDEPIDSNATKDGRARNRRIEFSILSR